MTGDGASETFKQFWKSGMEDGKANTRYMHPTAA